MEAQQISTKGTDTRLMEFDTVASDQFDTKSKNEKIITFINGRKRSKRDSSESAKRPKEWQDYLNRMLNYEMWQESLTYIWRHYEEYERFRLSIKEIVEIYINENIIVNLLDINKWLVKEYTPYDSINILPSLVDIGGEIFKDARSTNELETKSINAFIQMKAKTLLFKELK